MVNRYQITLIVTSLFFLGFLLWLWKSISRGLENCFKERGRLRRQQQERAAVFARIRLEEQQRRRQQFQRQQQDTTNSQKRMAKALRLERILESLLFETPTTNHGGSSLNGDEAPQNSVMERLFSSRIEQKKTVESALDDWSCGVCLESYQEGQALCCSIKDKTECKHVFHEVCAIRWFKEHSDCPLCRVRLIESDDDQNETIGIPPGP